MPRTEHVYVPYNPERGVKGGGYFAIGGVHWSPTGARDFLGGGREWRRLYRQGWRIVKCKLVPGRNDYSGARKNA